MNNGYTIRETIKFHSSEDIDMFIVKKMKVDSYDEAINIAKTLGDSEVIDNWTMDIVWNSNQEI